MGRASLPSGRLCEGPMNAIRMVMLSGTRTQQEKTAGDAWPGRLYGVRNTEGSSVSLRVEDGVLRGGKILCSGAGLVERALVTARHGMVGPQQMLLVLLPRGTARADLAAWTPPELLDWRKDAAGAAGADLVIGGARGGNAGSGPDRGAARSQSPRQGRPIYRRRGAARRALRAIPALPAISPERLEHYGKHHEARGWEVTAARACQAPAAPSRPRAA